MCVCVCVREVLRLMFTEAGAVSEIRSVSLRGHLGHNSWAGVRVSPILRGW